MALQTLTGGLTIDIGYPPLTSNLPASNTASLDAANEAVIFRGQVWWVGGGSKTIDTTGSSSIGWRTGVTTFSNGSTTVKVGLAAIDTANGPPGRASHVADVITFDVAASFTGGGGGITSSAWQTSVPTTGTKTIASGDFVACAIQMTARGGADIVRPSFISSGAASHLPGTTTFLGGSYATSDATPNIILTASDGTIGWFLASEVFSTISTRTWNSGSATVEYGQLYDLPFPYNVYGFYFLADPDNNFDVVLYSNPLGGSPVAERTFSVDANTVSSATGNRFRVFFSSPYSVGANTKIGAVLKPGASNISAYYRTLASSTHRVADNWGTTGYGISRASGAFADANSSLDHYYIGLIVGAFEHGVWPSGHLGV